MRGVVELGREFDHKRTDEEGIGAVLGKSMRGNTRNDWREVLLRKGSEKKSNYVSRVVNRDKPEETTARQE